MYKKIQQVQQKIGKLSKDKTNPFYKSKYLDINGLLEQLQPILDEVGLVVTQPLTNIDGKPAIRTVVCDIENEKMIDDVIVLPDLQDPQKMGSAITYYRRYALQSLFLLQAEDDDANLASSKSSSIVNTKTLNETPTNLPEGFPPEPPSYGPEPVDDSKCPDCGADMRTSKAGKKYCSAICWEKK